ncbi:hypothetical protein J31TS4_36380 [Paenibacillus sp. J31TS4]|uniref:hypothetical protein n=1 Tax=Paenibacillus sp. J31TS4 TaxID=2807195 RepID=UPI001B261D1A|nr:hypothetical protein [Paenibacillus sp. J31TS4]GIP40358.1 hypothetical protein J31TS4_36380 [Paenibacillus sp. J31TS4]
MFDPTIFDNLKVVLEGKLYELDRQGEALVIGREDRVELAGLSRTFLMRLRPPSGNCTAEIRLTSGLADFAGELRGLRLAGSDPGAVLTVRFELPGARSADAAELDTWLAGQWKDQADLLHEKTMQVNPQAADGEPDEGRYRITLRYRGKIDEDDTEELEALAAWLPQAFARMDD